MINDGQVIIFPTDTVYGMGCKLYDDIALAKLFEIKKRPVDKKIPILVSDIVSINRFATFTKRDLKIMNEFWPGALTLILNTNEEFYKRYNEKTIAVRIPNHYMAIKLIQENGPLRVTSANISGVMPSTDPNVLKELFENKVDKLYLEYDQNDFSNVSSTIIDVTNDEIKVLRQGDITLDEILERIK